MTVLDEVLKAETASATLIAEATAAAIQQVADAKKAHADTVSAEKVKLAEAEATALSVHEQTVQKKFEAITSAAEKEVATITAAFAENEARHVQKINDSIA